MNEYVNEGIYDDFAYVYARQEKYHKYSRDLADTIIKVMEEHDFWPKEVVDLACGVGVAAEIFRKAGHDVIGIDRSEQMLSYAKQRSYESELKIRFYTQDIENILLDKKVDLITCMYDSLNYITDESSFLRSMDSIISNLSEEGWFVFDIATPHALSSKWVGVDILRNNKDFFEIHSSSFDQINNVNIKKISFYIKDRDTFRHLFETHYEKAHSLEIVEELLESRGLDIIHKFSDPNRRPVSTDSDRIIYFARKRSR